MKLINNSVTDRDIDLIRLIRPHLKPARQLDCIMRHFLCLLSLNCMMRLPS
ncbi:hypothetical protein [Castellaniella ginsengisoli]|uniref:Uncharacterized protein n=1 Tax=Castellaniella ginsengisoli TaxID=546114 RepID=A0AB39DFU5_9BURK